MMKNDSLKQHGTLGIVENPSSRIDFNYRQTKIAFAHEVRNPLTNINLAVDALRSTDNIANQEIFLDIITRASFKIEDLMRNLLGTSRNGMKQSGKYSIHKLLDEVLESTDDRIVLKHIIIRKQYALRDCEIPLNEPEMKIAFTNIIVNAIEAIGGEGGILKILTKSNEGKFIIQIEDNGCGISKEDLKNIFKPYFTNKPGGLGLGLAATFDILRSNHCAINVESEVTKGTCFEISLDKNY
jgi:signal transduction histidine kinase